MADAEAAAQEGVQEAVEIVSARFQRVSADVEEDLSRLSPALS